MRHGGGGFLSTGAGVPAGRSPESKTGAGELWSCRHRVTWTPRAGVLPLQKMFQCPYFFFDVVYIHNGSDEKEEEMSWKVRPWQVWVAGGCRRGISGVFQGRYPTYPDPRRSHLDPGHSVIQQPFPYTCWELRGQLGWWAREQAGSRTLHPPYFLLLSLPAFALAEPSAWSTLPSLPPQALLVIQVPALN